MRESELNVLRFLDENGPSVAGAMGAIASSTRHRALNSLTALNCIVKEGTTYRILPDGEDALAAQRSGRPELLEPRLPIPHINLLPTAAHRAVLGLIAVAIVARLFKLRARHHPSFVLVGPKLKFKSVTGELACVMAGDDPATQLLCLSSESGRSIWTRSGARGKTVTKRNALEGRVLVLDDLRAPIETRRLLPAIINGSLEIPQENEILQLTAVPILCANPKKGTKTLTAMTDFDDAMLRRTIVVDLHDVEIPSDQLTEGDQILARARELGATEFPRPRHPEYDPRQLVQAALRTCFMSSEEAAGVNVNMLSMLAAAATSWLSPSDAIHYVMTSYLTVASTRALTHPDWSRRLAECLTDSGRDTVTTSNPSGYTSRPNPFDYDETVDAVIALCDSRDLTPAAAAERLDMLEHLERLGIGAGDLEDLVSYLADANIDPCTLGPTLGNQVRRHQNLLAAVADLEAQRRRARAQLDESREKLQHTHRLLHAAQVPPEELAELRRTREALNGFSLAPSMVFETIDAAAVAAKARRISLHDAFRQITSVLAALATSAAKHEDGSAEVEDLVRRIAAAAKAGRSIESERDRLRGQLEKAKRDLQATTDAKTRSTAALESTQAAVGELRRDLASLEREIDERLLHRDQVAEDHRYLRNDIARTHALIDFLAGRVLLHPLLRDALLSAARWVGPAPPPLSAATRAYVLEILEREAVASPTQSASPTTLNKREKAT